MPETVKRKRFAHNQASTYGGYGYNYQYLGNTRFPFSASDAAVQKPAETVAVADTNGCSFDAGVPDVGNYVVDPPLPSILGSRPTTPGDGFYGAGSECIGANGCRAMPAERHSGMVSVVFADGHSKAMRLSALDDYNKDGARDNGWWNGFGDPARR